jgi:DNA polymerase III sliding clamp (beta) subunit (PCNA family)
MNGEAILIGVNPDYVMDFLRHADSRVKCELKDGASVMKFSDGTAFEYVVMSMRL